MKLLYSLTLFSVVLPLSAHAVVTITSNKLSTFIRDGSSTLDFYEETGVIEQGRPIYGRHHLLSTNYSDLSAALEVNYTRTHRQTVLCHQSILNTDGIYSHVAQTFGSTTNFTVDRNATYKISGLLQVLDQGSAGRVYTRIHLYDETDKKFLLNNFQESEATRNEQFEAGEQEGDKKNSRTGSLTGSLQPGHNYELYWSYVIRTISKSEIVTRATGDLTLTIEESIVPYFDSPTIIIWSMIAAYGGVLYYRGGKRKKEPQKVASDAANNEPGKELSNKLTTKKQADEVQSAKQLPHRPQQPSGERSAHPKGLLDFTQ